MENNFDDVNNNSNNNNNNNNNDNDEVYLYGIIIVILLALLVFGNLRWFLIGAIVSVLLVKSAWKVVLKIVLFGVVVAYFLIPLLTVGACVNLIEAL